MVEDAGDIETRRKRLLFRSWHRGMKEMDLLLGRFAERNVVGFAEREVALYEELLTHNDPDLYNWITGKEPAPESLHHEVMKSLQAFTAGVRKE